MTIEIVNFPIKNGGSFHSYVKLPEGKDQADDVSNLSDEQRLTVWQWIATTEGLGFHIFPSSTVHKVDVSMDHGFSGIKIIHNHP